MLNAASDLITIGEAVSHSSYPGLKDSLKTQSLQYVKHAHGLFAVAVLMCRCVVLMCFGVWLLCCCVAVLLCGCVVVLLCCCVVVLQDKQLTHKQRTIQQHNDTTQQQNNT